HDTSPLFPYTTLFRSRRAYARAQRSRVSGTRERSLEGHTHDDLRICRYQCGDRGSQSWADLRVRLQTMGSPGTQIDGERRAGALDRKSTRLNSSHVAI